MRRTSAATGAAAALIAQQASLVITFEVDGRQFVAVGTGLGGGSPRGVPSLNTPEIQPPNRGHALYVFALPR